MRPENLSLDKKQLLLLSIDFAIFTLTNYQFYNIRQSFCIIFTFFTTYNRVISLHIALTFFMYDRVLLIVLLISFPQQKMQPFSKHCSHLFFEWNLGLSWIMQISFQNCLVFFPHFLFGLRSFLLKRLLSFPLLSLIWVEKSFTKLIKSGFSPIFLILPSTILSAFGFLPQFFTKLGDFLSIVYILIFWFFFSILTRFGSFLLINLVLFLLFFLG